MEENFFDFAQTKEALSQLSTDLAVLDSEIKSKLTELDVERKNHHKAHHVTVLTYVFPMSRFDVALFDHCILQGRIYSLMPKEPL